MTAQHLRDLPYRHEAKDIDPALEEVNALRAEVGLKPLAVSQDGVIWELRAQGEMATYETATLFNIGVFLRGWLSCHYSWERRQPLAGTLKTG